MKNKTIESLRGQTVGLQQKLNEALRELVYGCLEEEPTFCQGDEANSLCDLVTASDLEAMQSNLKQRQIEIAGIEKILKENQYRNKTRKYFGFDIHSRTCIGCGASIAWTDKNSPEGLKAFLKRGIVCRKGCWIDGILNPDTERRDNGRQDI